MATGKYQVSRRFDCYDPSRRDYVRGSKNLTTCRDYEFKKNDGFYHSSSARKLESKHREHQLSDLQPPLEKKRKLCSSVWHGEDKEIKVSSKNRVIPVSVLNPSLSPSMPPLNGNSGGRVTNSFVSANQVDEFELPIANQPLEGDEHESSVVEDGEFIHERSISMSRWASDIDSPKHICASDDEEMPQKSSFSEGRGSSPESGEFLVGSSGHRSRSSGLTEVGQTNEICLDEFEDGDNDVSMDDDHTCSSNVNSDQDDMDECDLDHQELEEPLLPVCRSVCMLNSCRSVFDYEKLNKINEGTYGVVYRARDKKTGEIVALKKVKMNQRDADGGFPLTSLREINILLSLNHPSVVGVKEVVMGDLDDIYMVMEYMEHDLKGLMEMRKRPFSTSEVKCLMLQLLEGVKYLHDNWVLHRDLKTSNLLFNNKGELKICDFGLSRQYGSPSKPYTPLVVTMWYRAPELLLGAKQYSTAIDMWSVGCIMAEMLANEPLFKGNSEVNQLDKIFRTLGTPNEKIWPGLSQLPGSKANFVKQPYNLLRKKFPAASFTGITVLSESGFDLLNRLLTYDPEKRIMADEALTHEWFSEVPLPTCKDFMPTFPPLNAADRKLH